MTTDQTNDAGEAVAAPPMVHFEKVTKRYGPLTVLDQLDLAVAAHEKVAIIGPSGSGKTTVLRMLMTLETIDSGLISIDGEPLTHMQQGEKQVRANAAHLRRMRSQIGMVFQHFNLFPHMTALKNCMEAPVTVLGLSKDEAHARAADLLAQVGLADKLDHYPAQLSGGQQQRVAIARALAMRPKVMLFDEVTSALDPELCRRGAGRDPQPGAASTSSPCSWSRTRWVSRASSPTACASSTPGASRNRGRRRPCSRTRRTSARSSFCAR